RTALAIDNPYTNGRILLHFEGAGQKTQVYIHTQKVAEHVGGYDEWTVDITDAVSAFKATDIYKEQFAGKVPVVIRSDNSRDVELIPSDLSDFNLYGGLYRYVNLVYVPPLSIDKLFAAASVDANGQTGHIQLDARYYNPRQVQQADAVVELFDAHGRRVALQKQQVATASGSSSLGGLTVKQPVLWSPTGPSVYANRSASVAGGD